ncbi:hypothetical protein A6J33_004240 [Pantoea sp. FDAARGOS_194]|nr:hypothetical protein A6J33_004240 [Pantoea sp. FDAARGOS_194]
MDRRAKRPAPGTKTPGAFLNNATRWPGDGRPSGMRGVIARAELAGMPFLRLCDRAISPALAQCQ